MNVPIIFLYSCNLYLIDLLREVVQLFLKTFSNACDISHASLSILLGVTLETQKSLYAYKFTHKYYIFVE